MDWNKSLSLFYLLLTGSIIYSQNTVTTSLIKNYKNWKWDNVLVTQNNYISLAVAPDTGGRILEYNLGDTPSLWINPELFGKSFKPTDKVKFNEWRNFGGYRLVPLPRNNFAFNASGKKTKRWPPPAIWGDSPYKATIGTTSNGLQTIEVTSGTQKLPVPMWDRKTKDFTSPKTEEEMVYSRNLYLIPESSLVHITHKITNVGKKTIHRGIMTSSQHVSRSKPELTDGENFSAFVPFNKKNTLENGKPYHITSTPESRWRYINKNRFPLDKNNPEHIKKYFNAGTNWKGEVSQGIYEATYDYNQMGGLDIIASKPWVAYVNKINNTAFAKIIEPFDPKLEYDDKVNVSIFSSGLSTGYLETEVRTPIYKIAPKQSAQYIEIHGAAKIASTPILDINNTGIITAKASYNNKTVNGAYGVFIAGKAIVVVLDSNGKTIYEKEVQEVNPLAPFILNHKIEELLNIASIQIFIKNKNHLLDTINLN